MGKYDGDISLRFVSLLSGFGPMQATLGSGRDLAMNIAVIGMGYVGLVSGACVAELGHNVIGMDNDLSKIRALREGYIPIHERHLPELLQKHLGRRLTLRLDLHRRCKLQM
jgi:UDP-N-acetyl-D-mannosaminuronate dehydrogenase